MYLTNTRPDICFVVNTLSQYLVQPRWVHLVAAKHVMRYLKGTIDFGLYCDGSHEYRLYGYIDADWAGSISNRKSTSSRCFCLRSSMSSWFSKKQSSVSLSTVEAEYIVDCSTKLWSHMASEADIRSLWPEYGHSMILCDKRSCDDKEPCVPT